MSTYKIKSTNDNSELAEVEAGSAIEAINQYCEEHPDEDTGFQRGGLNIDAETRGQNWATVKTDGGRISADLA